MASCEVRGAAPGTRETELLDPTKSVEKIHAILLSGGSAFGLAAASGVVAFLEELGEGVRTPHMPVPLVPAAVVYDLGVGNPRVRPGFAEGLEAAQNASSDAVPGGRVGAGTGVLCGKYLGFPGAEPGGVGSALIHVGGVRLTALVVANPSGDVVDASGRVVAGARKENGSRPSVAEMLEALTAPDRVEFLRATNTTLVVVGTDARLTKVECRRLAEAAQMGLARGTRPSHMPSDGDTAFVFSVGDATAPGVTGGLERSASNPGFTRPNLSGDHGTPPAGNIADAAVAGSAHGIPLAALVAATQEVVAAALVQAVLP